MKNDIIPFPYRVGPNNPNYIKVQDLVKQVIEYREKMRQNMWNIAVILHRIFKEHLYTKAGYMSMEHFLSSVKLTKSYLILAMLPQFMTEEEFNMVGQTKARLLVKFLRAFPDARTEVFEIACSSHSVGDMRKRLQKKYPVGHDVPEVLSMSGSFDEVTHVREMVDLLLESKQYGNRPIEVLEYCLAEQYTEILAQMGERKDGEEN